MFPFRSRKKDKKDEELPRWFMWVLGGFIIYALLANLFADPLEQYAGGENGPAGRTEGAVDFRAVQGPRGLPFSKKDITEGSGKEAGCWDKVAVHYQMIKPDGTVIESREEATPHRFAIGRGEVVPALERGIMGMMPGGTRHIAAKPSEAYGAPGFSHPQIGSDDFIGFIVTLQEVKRPQYLPKSELGLKIYDDDTGNGALVQCTDRVQFRASAFNLHGKSLWSQGVIATARLGEGMLPYAVERGLMGMRVNGQRTLIVPVGYMNPVFGEKPLMAEEPDKPQDEAALEVSPEVRSEDIPEDAPESEALSDFPVPENEVILLELELLQRGVTPEESQP